MLQIKVSRNDVFEQMPRSVRRAMIGEEVPEFFTFNVEKLEVASFPEEEKVRSEFHDLHMAFSQTEWYMFCLLVTLGEEVPVGVLAARIKYGGANPSNGVSVHIKNMRKKIKKLSAPLEIKAISGGKIKLGSYQLIRL